MGLKITGVRKLDCEQPLFLFRFSKGSARARERRAAKLRDARNEGGSPRRVKGDALLSCLSCLAPSVTRVVICVSRAFCSTDQEKRETARSLYGSHRLTIPVGDFDVFFVPCSLHVDHIISYFFTELKIYRHSLFNTHMTISTF